MKKLNNFTKNLIQVDTGEYVALFIEDRHPRWQLGLGFNAAYSEGQCNIDPEDHILKSYDVMNNRGSLHKKLNNVLSNHMVMVAHQVIICSVIKIGDFYTLQEYKNLSNKEQIREFKRSLDSN